MTIDYLKFVGGQKTPSRKKINYSKFAPSFNVAEKKKPTAIQPNLFTSIQPQQQTAIKPTVAEKTTNFIDAVGQSPFSKLPFEYTKPRLSTTKVDASGRKVTVFSEELGGGAYYDTMADRPPTTPRGNYGGVPSEYGETGKERDHITSLFLGGVDTKENIRLRQSANLIERFLSTPAESIPDSRRQEGKYAKEYEIYNKYKNDKINRAEAISALKRWEFEQEIKATNVQDIAKNTANNLFDLGKKFAQVVLPKALEYKTGITEKPKPMEFKVGEGLKKREFTTSEMIDFGLAPFKLEHFTKDEKKAAETIVRKQDNLPSQPLKEFYNDLRLAKDAFKMSEDKSSYISALGINLFAKTLTVTKGSEGASVNDKSYLLKKADSSLEDLRKTDPLSADIIDSLAFSLSAQGSALLTGAATSLVTRNPIAFLSAASGVSGAMAYRMSKYQIMQNYLEIKNGESITQTGKGISRAEEDRLKKDFESKAKQYGLWEAVPEAIAGGLGFGLLTNQFKKMFGEKLAGSLAQRLGVFYGEELATETVTQMGQTSVMAQAGFPGVKDIDWTSRTDWLNALKDVAPQTFLLSTILGGSVSLATKIQTVRQEIKDENIQKAVIAKLKEAESLQQPAKQPTQQQPKINFAKVIETKFPKDISTHKTTKTEPKQPQIEAKATEVDKVAPPAKQAPKTAELDPTDFKTADEYVRAQGTPVYHGSPRADLKEIGFGTGVRSNPFMGTSKEVQSPSIFFSKDKSVAETFAKNRVEYLQTKNIKGTPTVYERFIPKKGMLDLTKPQNVDKVFEKLKISTESELEGLVPNYGLGEDFSDALAGGRVEMGDLFKIFDDPKLVKKFKDAGYTGVRLIEKGNLGESVAIFDPKKAFSKSQLIEEWNKANKVVAKKPALPKKTTVDGENLPVGTSKGKDTSSFSKHYERIKDQFGFSSEGVEFTQIINKDQIKKAYNHIQRNPEKALKVAYGFEKPPIGINVQAIRASLSVSLAKAGKTAIAEEIAKLASKGYSEAAQTLQFARVDTSPQDKVQILRKITDARLEKIGRQAGEVDITKMKEAGETVVKKESAKAKKEVVKDQVKNSKENLSELDSIIQSIIC